MSRRISEERTRKEMIDPQLELAGWYLRDYSTVSIKRRHSKSFPKLYNYKTNML
jgi:type I site-specific restriction endonuclease